MDGWVNGGSSRVRVCCRVVVFFVTLNFILATGGAWLLNNCLAVFSVLVVVLRVTGELLTGGVAPMPGCSWRWQRRVRIVTRVAGRSEHRPVAEVAPCIHIPVCYSHSHSSAPGSGVRSSPPLIATVVILLRLRLRLRFRLRFRLNLAGVAPCCPFGNPAFAGASK